MDFILQNWFLIAMAVISGGLLMWPNLTGASAGGGVAPAEAVRLLNREKAVFIDVSEPAEYQACHVAQARNVPLGSLNDSKLLPSNKALPVVVFCPRGARATKGAAALRKLGYTQVSVVQGGTQAWQEAQLPVEKS